MLELRPVVFRDDVELGRSSSTILGEMRSRKRLPVPLGKTECPAWAAGSTDRERTDVLELSRCRRGGRDGEARYGEEERGGAAAPLRARGTSALEAPSMGRRGLPPARAGMWRCHISLGSKTGNLLCPSTNRREAQRARRGAAALTSYGSKLGASGVGGKGRL